jgi:hypothetical protein
VSLLFGESKQDPDPQLGFSTTKIDKFSMENKQKYLLRSPNDFQTPWKASSIPEKKTQSLLKQMKILNYFRFLWAALPPGSVPNP